MKNILAILTMLAVNSHAGAKLKQQDFSDPLVISSAASFGGPTTFYAAVSIASHTAATSFLRFGRDSGGLSFITNSNASGFLRLMPGKANPQIILGDAATTGSIFWDATSGRPFNIGALSTGTVTIGGGGLITLGSPVTISPAFAFTLSSAAFMGVSYSTQAAGGAGSAVTVTCPSGKFADYGGCNCTGFVSATAIVNRPNSVTAGAIPTGHTCQVVGGSGGACAAFVRCSVIQ